MKKQIKKLFNKLFTCNFNEPLCKDNFFGCRCGKGETTLQQAPTTPAPSATESAADIYKARLQYDPLVAQQEMDIQKQMLPQQSALYQSLYNQYYPQLAKTQQALQQELYPTQSKILEAGAGQALERIQNPMYMTAQEQAAQEATRGKAVSDLQRAMRERSNLGGGLYGGRSQASEAQSVSDLLNQFQTQDYQNRMVAGQNAQSALAPYLSILYPQIGTTQPNYSPYTYQSVVPSADQLYQSIFQASQPNYYTSQSADNTGAYAQMGGQLGGAALMAMMMSSIRYKKNIRPYEQSLRYN